MEKGANYGFMTDTEISEAINNQDREIIIFPFNEKNLTPIGYNFSFSRFIVSLSKGNFVTLVNDKKTGVMYFDLRPSETVLVLSKETVSVSANIGGTFHSKVSLVAKGLGHVSTTLDPGWQGQLLVPLNNPTNRKVRVFINKRIYDKQSDSWSLVDNTFLTLVFFKAQEGATNISPNRPARIELLDEILKSRKPSKARQKLIEQVNRIRVAYGNGNIIKLGTIADRRANYDAYIQQQKRLNNDLDTNYPLVKKAAEKLAISSYIRFVLLGIVTFAILLGLAIFSFFTVNARIADSLKLIVPVLTSFSIFFLTHIKDRFI
jgi:Deoxycytidine deaminase